MKLLITVLLTVGLTCSAAASPIVVGGSATWTSSGGAAFWNNTSYDRNGYANVGVFLTGTPGSDIPNFYANSPSLTDLSWLGTGSTTFTWDGPVTATTLVGVTGWQDQFWIDNGVFFFQSPYHTWRSDTLDGGRSHFALFDSPAFYYLGMEDATWTTSRTADWDYNDKIVRIPKTIPDPASTLMLMGVGLSALAIGRRWCAASHPPTVEDPTR